MKYLRAFVPSPTQLLDIAMVAVGAAIGADSQRPPGFFFIIAGVFCVLAIARAWWER